MQLGVYFKGPTKRVVFLWVSLQNHREGYPQEKTQLALQGGGPVIICFEASDDCAVASSLFALRDVVSDM